MEADLRFFTNGALSGMCGLIISHPFDTIKTSIQTNKHIKYNIKTLYHGVIPPLLGVGLEKAIVFGSYNFSYKYTNSIFLSGCLAGISAKIGRAHV